MKQCSLFFFLSNNFFHAENVRFLLLIQFLCGGSESLCQRFALRLMTYDMGKKVNSQRESLVYSCGEVQGEGTNFWRGKTARAFTILFNSFRYCVSLVHFQLTDRITHVGKSNVENTKIRLLAKSLQNMLQLY